MSGWGGGGGGGVGDFIVAAAVVLVVSAVLIPGIGGMGGTGGIPGISGREDFGGGEFCGDRTEPQEDVNEDGDEITLLFVGEWMWRAEYGISNDDCGLMIIRIGY